ncbi:MAG TPA: large conductance mechanosensitive channel protein MscL [Actinomycetota bacterium]|jgi:large conductance mechanosensitive channel
MIRGFLKEFREFAFRGNMVDLAVGIIIGAAFGAVVNSLAKDVLMNLIAAVFQKPNYSDFVWHVGTRGQVPYGRLLTEIVSFLMVAVALFFVIKAINRMMGLRDAQPEPLAKRICPYCRTSIPAEASRCPACTSEVEPATA